MRLGTSSPDILPNSGNHFPQGVLSQVSKETKKVHLRKGTVRPALSSLHQEPAYNQTGYVPRKTSVRLLFPPILSVHHPSRHLGILLNPETGRQSAVHNPQTNLAAALDHELGMARGTPSGTARAMVDPQGEKQANASSNDFGTVGSSSCGIYTGARVGPSELFSLTWDDLDLAHGVISMPSANKGDRLAKRDVPIRKELLSLLAQWQRQDGDCPYVISWAGKPVRKIGSAWKTAIRKAGIRPFRPYDLRHAYATAIRSGVDLKTSAEIMGHESARMILDVYEHVDWAQKARAIEAMPNFLGASFSGRLQHLPHKRSVPKNEINDGGTRQRVGNAVSIFHDREAFSDPEVEQQHNHPANEDAEHKGEAEQHYPPVLQQYAKIKSGDKNDLAQQVKQKKLKQKVQNSQSARMFPQPEYSADKQDYPSKPRTDMHMNPPYTGAPFRNTPG